MKIKLKIWRKQFEAKIDDMRKQYDDAKVTALGEGGLKNYTKKLRNFI